MATTLILITGVSPGNYGESIARVMAERAANVGNFSLCFVLTSLTKAVRHVESYIASLGMSAVSLVADLTTPRGIEDVAQAVLLASKHRSVPLSYCVLNHGVISFIPVKYSVSDSSQVAHYMSEVNFYSYVKLFDRLSELRMVSKDCTRLGITSSINLHVSSSILSNSMGHYARTKHSVAAWALSSRVTSSVQTVTVSCPAAMDTPLFFRSLLARNDPVRPACDEGQTFAVSYHDILTVPRVRRAYGPFGVTFLLPTTLPADKAFASRDVTANHFVTDMSTARSTNLSFSHGYLESVLLNFVCSCIPGMDMVYITVAHILFGTNRGFLYVFWVVLTNPGTLLFMLLPLVYPLLFVLSLAPLPDRPLLLRHRPWEFPLRMLREVVFTWGTVELWLWAWGLPSIMVELTTQSFTAANTWVYVTTGILLTWPFYSRCVGHGSLPLISDSNPHV